MPRATSSSLVAGAAAAEHLDLQVVQRDRGRGSGCGCCAPAPGCRPAASCVPGDPPRPAARPGRARRRSRRRSPVARRASSASAGVARGDREVGLGQHHAHVRHDGAEERPARVQVAAARRRARRSPPAQRLEGASPRRTSRAASAGTGSSQNTHGIARRSSIAVRAGARRRPAADVQLGESRPIGRDRRGRTRRSRRCRRPARGRPRRRSPRARPSASSDAAPRSSSVGVGQRGLQRGRQQRLEVAAGEVRRSEYLAATISPCSVMRIAAVDRSRRLGQDRVVARAAAAADRAAAAVEQPQAHAVAAATSTSSLLGPVQRPLGGEVAAVLVGVGVADHHLLAAAARASSSRR